MAEQMLSDELIERVKHIAHHQNRRPAEVVEEAVRRYLSADRLAMFANEMGNKAASLGIREEDVPQLVDDIRRDKARAR